jgi:exodeoxyribonuclease-5
MRGSAIMLTEVKRQEDGSYILGLATGIREAIDQKQSNFPMKGFPPKNIYTASEEYVREIKKEGNEHTVAISVSHRANAVFNDLVRTKLHGKDKKLLEPGDLLMVNQNWTRGGVSLHSGEHVEVLDVDWSQQEEVCKLLFVPVKVKVLFTADEIIIEDYANLHSLLLPGGKMDEIQFHELRKHRIAKNNIYENTLMPADDRYIGALQFIYGHAITCNKAQGGEWKKVFVNVLGIPSLKWQYTAVTRAQETLVPFGK